MNPNIYNIIIVVSSIKTYLKYINIPNLHILFNNYLL